MTHLSQTAIWLTLIGMALATYLTRVATMLALRGDMAPWLRRWLGYVPVAVFTALALPPLLLQSRDADTGRGLTDQELRNEVLTLSGQPFSVFTPYARAWRARLSPGDLAAHDCTPRPGQLVHRRPDGALPHRHRHRQHRADGHDDRQPDR
ncbi:MAG TPA: AzlD domain-containing protein, partial [Kouleothrix sp.]|nr:AzlD domain-containing protein [Kouleothrix sp.]